MATNLEVVISAKDEASAKIKAVSQAASEMGGTFLAIGGTITAALGVAVKMAADAEVQMAQFNTTLKNSAGVTDDVRNSLLKASDATLKLGFDNEASANSLAKFFQRTGDVTEAINLNNTAMDLARAKNIDLNTAATLVNQVLSGNGKVLKQYGIDLKEAGTPLQALNELHTKVGGSAVAFSKTFEGSMQIMQQATGELGEKIGGVLLPILTNLATYVSGIIDQITAWTEANPELTKNIVIFAGVIGGLLTVIGTLGVALPVIAAGLAVFANPITWVVLAVVGLTAAFVAFHDKFTAVMDYIDQKTGVITYLKLVWDLVVDTIMETVVPAFQNLWLQLQPYIPMLEDLAKVFGVILVAAIVLVVGTIAGAIIVAAKLLQWGLDFESWVLKGGKAAFDSIATAISGIATWAQNAYNWVQQLISALSKVGGGVAKSIGGSISSAVSAVSSAVGLKADGGNVSAGSSYIVGEAGAELFTPNTSGYITSNGKVGGGGGTIVVNVNGGNYLSEDAARMFGNILVDKLQLISQVGM
jgi:hypothetical protein